MNSVRPRWDESSRSPPIRTASSRAIARPRPEPPELVAGVEAFEDSVAVVRVDSGSVVSDGHLDGAAALLCRDGDRGSLRGVGQRVVNEDTKDLRQPIGVGGGDGVSQTLDRQLRAMSLDHRAELGRHALGQPSRVDAVGSKLKRVGVQLREVEEVGGQLLEPRDLLAHRSHELGAGLRIRVLVLEQLDEPAEREDGGAQLVRGVRDELLAGTVQARQALLHLVERARELAHLVGRVHRDLGAEVALGDQLGRLVQAPQPPGVGASREPARRQRREDRDPAGDQDLAL